MPKYHIYLEGRSLVRASFVLDAPSMEEAVEAAQRDLDVLNTPWAAVGEITDIQPSVVYDYDTNKLLFERG